MYTFKVKNEVYQVPLKYITGTILETYISASLKVEKDEDAIIINDEPHRFEFLLEYFEGKNPYPSLKRLEILDYYCVPQDYKYIFFKEEIYRTHLYREEELQEPTYDLLEITQEFWESLTISDEKPPELLFKPRLLEKRSWEEIQSGLSNLPDIRGNVIAGGRIFSLLFKTHYSDTDIFLIGDRENALRFIKGFHVPSEMPYECQRTKNAITITSDNRDCGKEVHQIILRLYISISEVLHGFDVDCCGLGVQNGKIYMSRRAHWVITHGYNTVNIKRLSPSYEYRLAKYAMRGLQVYLEGFQRSKVRELDDYISNCAHGYKQNQFHYHVEPISKLHFLDRLLILEHHTDKKYKNKELDILAEKNSDYALPYWTHSHNTIDVNDWFEYLCSTSGLLRYKEYRPDIERKKDNENSIQELNAMGFKIGYSLFPEISVDSPKQPMTTICIGALKDIININPLVYKMIGARRPWNFPRKLAFKTINPGEQSTGTFHSLHLETLTDYFRGRFYIID